MPFLVHRFPAFMERIEIDQDSLPNFFNTFRLSLV